MLFELFRSVAPITSIRVRLNAVTRRPLAMPMSAAKPLTMANVRWRIWTTL
jgi:hypothetical protein